MAFCGTFERAGSSPTILVFSAGGVLFRKLCFSRAPEWRTPARSPAGFVRCLLMIAKRRRPGLALAVASPLWLWGCAATVYPPQRVAEPVQVGVLDHGRHSSLIVQIPGGMLRYSYGDWNWYALRQTGPAQGSSALLWPTKAALGRKELPGPFSLMAVSREVRVAIEDALYLTVDARAVRRLVDRLDRIYYENSASHVYNEVYDLVFVPHPDPYSISRNSNRAVADWLEQLECRVEGTTLLSVWQLGTD